MTQLFYIDMHIYKQQAKSLSSLARPSFYGKNHISLHFLCKSFLEITYSQAEVLTT